MVYLFFRMIDKKNDQDNNSFMIDISYSQDKNGSQVDVVFDKLYVCVSVEFLMIVVDFFIKVMFQSLENIVKEIQILLRQIVAGRVKMEKGQQNLFVCFEDVYILINIRNRRIKNLRK